MTTVIIEWVAGDKPLPLNVNMDLTGADPVVLKARSRDAADSPGLDVPNDVVDQVAGDLDADPSDLTPGAYSLKARVFRGGVLVATFPNHGEVVLLLKPAP